MSEIAQAYDPIAKGPRRCKHDRGLRYVCNELIKTTDKIIAHQKDRNVTPARKSGWTVHDTRKLVNDTLRALDNDKSVSDTTRGRIEADFMSLVERTHVPSLGVRGQPS